VQSTKSSHCNLSSRNNPSLPPSQERLLRIGESDPLAASPILQHPILDREKLDDEQLTSMPQARHNGQAKRQKWRLRSHADSLPQTPFEYWDTSVLQQRSRRLEMS
jgi:hypothetical protein